MAIFPNVYVAMVMISSMGIISMSISYCPYALLGQYHEMKEVNSIFCVITQGKLGQTIEENDISICFEYFLDIFFVFEIKNPLSPFFSFSKIGLSLNFFVTLSQSLIFLLLLSYI